MILDLKKDIKNKINLISNNNLNLKLQNDNLKIFLNILKKKLESRIIKNEN